MVWLTDRPDMTLDVYRGRKMLDVYRGRKMRAASQLPGRGPTVVDMAPIPAR